MKVRYTTVPLNGGYGNPTVERGDAVQMIAGVHREERHVKERLSVALVGPMP